VDRKKAIIVGSSGAVGTAISELLQSKNYELIATSSRKDSKGKHYLNFTDLETVESFAEQQSSIDLLVIAAGKEPQQSLMEISLDHLNSMIDIHYRGPLWLVKKLRSKMNENSCIVFIGSVAAQKGSYDPSYSSLKSGVAGLVRTLARELSPNITVGNVAPGLIRDSPVFERMTDDFRARHLQNNIMGTLLKPKEVAEMIFVFTEQKQLTGQTIHLNGGQYFAG
jgi:NAD(P)-dependent dehydrogenase (short-subunit alcohol dehydrogenase family)